MTSRLPPPRTGTNQPSGPAITLGEQQYNLGKGLLSNPIAGNGVGKVQMPNSQVARNTWGQGQGVPTLNTSTATNPWLAQQGAGIMNQTNQMLSNNLLGIQGNSVASGGLGGSRQGIAQGTALGQASNYLSANLADMYGSAYESDANRNMQKYGIDTNSYLGQRGQDVAMRGQDIQNYGQNLDFYTAQRGQDMGQAQLGAGLITQGLNTQWLPMQNAADIYAKFQGNGTTTTTGSSGGGWQGAINGALGAYQYGNANWWGGK